jgi:hypothetical protein
LAKLRRTLLTFHLDFVATQKRYIRLAINEVLNSTFGFINELEKSSLSSSHYVKLTLADTLSV